MANVHVLSVSMIDDAGERAACTVYLPATATLAEVQAFSDQFAGHLDDIVGAKIDRIGVNLALTLPVGLKADPDADVSIHKGANFSFDVADTVYKHTVHVPAISPVVVTAGEVVVDNANVLLVTGDLVNGTGVLDPSNEFALDLVSFIGARLSFRK